MSEVKVGDYVVWDRNPNVAPRQVVAIFSAIESCGSARYEVCSSNGDMRYEPYYLDSPSSATAEKLMAVLDGSMSAFQVEHLKVVKADDGTIKRELNLPEGPLTIQMPRVLSPGSQERVALAIQSWFSHP